MDMKLKLLRLRMGIMVKKTILTHLLLSSINEDKEPLGMKTTGKRRCNNMRIKPGFFIEDEGTGEMRKGGFNTPLVICRMSRPEKAAEETSFQLEQNQGSIYGICRARW